jgi:hypothetical protein
MNSIIIINFKTDKDCEIIKMIKIIVEKILEEYSLPTEKLEYSDDYNY